MTGDASNASARIPHRILDKKKPEYSLGLIDIFFITRRLANHFDR